MTGQLTIIERRIDVHMKSLCMLTAVYGGISLWGLEVSRLGGKGGTGVGGRAGFSSMRWVEEKSRRKRLFVLPYLDSKEIDCSLLVFTLSRRFLSLIL